MFLSSLSPFNIRRTTYDVRLTTYD